MRLRAIGSRIGERPDRMSGQGYPKAHAVSPWMAAIENKNANGPRHTVLING